MKEMLARLAESRRADKEHRRLMEVNHGWKPEPTKSVQIAYHRTPFSDFALIFVALSWAAIIMALAVVFSAANVLSALDPNEWVDAYIRFSEYVLARRGDG